MNLEIKYGAAVSGFYEDGSGELLGVFQYKEHADKWAQDYISNLDKDLNYFIIRTCLYSGKSKAFVHKPDVHKERKEN